MQKDVSLFVTFLHTLIFKGLFLFTNENNWLIFVKMICRFLRIDMKGK